MAKYQLTARAQINGSIQEPGYIFELKEGERGPHRTVVASHHGASIGAHKGDELKDEPLYVEYKEPVVEKKKEFAPSVADTNFKGA